jgi:hypothetical protein
MGVPETGKQIPNDDAAAIELRSAVHPGDVEAIQRRTCHKRSGMPAPAASVAPPSICCHAGPISTESRTMRTAHRLTPPVC